MSKEAEMTARKYLYNSYEDTITIQIYLADNNIPFSYTDQISFSEMNFIFNKVKEYVKEKNAVQ